MQEAMSGVVTRRLAIGAFAVGAGQLAFAGQVEVQVRPITQRGMVGGGLARFDDSEAEFSLFASRFTLPDTERDIVVGQVLWHDAQAELTLASTEVTSYDVVEATSPGETRRIAGAMRVNDGETYPFVLNVTDAGLPGEGLDSVALLVGAAAEGTATPPADAFSFAAAGPIVLGDVQEVNLEVGGAPAPPSTPEG